MGCFGFGVRNQEGENIVGLCQEHNLRVMNSYYRKRREHLITYKSGSDKSQIDYSERLTPGKTGQGSF